MRINGEWYECDDGIVRPVVRGEVLAAGGTWVTAEFLLDTGADRSVFAAELLAVLRLPPQPILDDDGTPQHLSGGGGAMDAVLVATRVRLTRDDGGKTVLRGQYAAVTDPTALDMSVMARDITDLFASVVDRPAGTVFLFAEPHRYRIEQATG